MSKVFSMLIPLLEVMKNTGKTHFKSKGVGVKSKQKPVSVMLPEKLDAIVRSLPNRSEFLREAITEKAIREKLLPSD